MIPVKMFYNPAAIATILSVKDVLNVDDVDIFFDLKRKRSMFVIYKNEVFEFKEHRDGLYFYDRNNINDKINIGFTSVQTVQGNIKKYAKNDVKRAEEVTNLQEHLFWPGTKRFAQFLHDNQIQNCELTNDDVVTRDHIFGTPTPLLRGKSTGAKPEKHTRDELYDISNMIPTRYMDLQIFMDIFYVNGNIFCLTTSENIGHKSVQALKTQKHQDICQGIGLIRDKYETRGFTLNTWHTDTEFNTIEIQRAVAPAQLEPYARNEHV